MKNHSKIILMDIFELTALIHKKFGPSFSKMDMSKYHCNKNQIRFMMLLDKLKESNPTELGKLLDMKKGSLTTLIDSLENKKLVLREKDPSDRRKTLIVLTDDGILYIQNKKKQIEDYVSETFKNLSESEKISFEDNVENIIAILKKL